MPHSHSSDSSGETPSASQGTLPGHEISAEESPTSADVAQNLEEHEPCPTPLVWHNILSTFLQEAEHWYLDSPEGQIRGRTWGTGPTLYFLNGMSGTHELYCLLVWLLREDYRCVLFDYPDSANVSHQSLGASLLEVAHRHGETAPMTVLTRDFGWQVAQHCLEQDPGAISTLICQTPSVGLPLTRSEQRLARLGRHLGMKAKRLPGRHRVQQQVHRIWFPPYDDSRFQFYLDNSGEQSIRSLSQRFLLNGIAHTDPGHNSAIDQVLLIRTEGETLLQSGAAEQLAQQFPNAESEWLHTSGQLAFLTHPHRLAKSIKEFLVSTSPDSTDHSPPSEPQ